MSHQTTGVILTNLGTPNAPTTKAVRSYLAEFLMDRRVVELPRPLWFCILYGIILPFRSRQSAKLYQSIWQDNGSPLLVTLQQQARALQEALQENNIFITYGMRYGQPSIATALKQCKAKQCAKIIILPLYPQYSAATTASTFDAISKELRNWREIPEIHFINQYFSEPGYIKAIANSITSHWQQAGHSDKLIFSYHGLPKQFIEKGDPYYSHCQQTTALVAKELNLKSNDYVMTFQSRLGKAAWLEPYTDVALQQLGQQHKSVAVICPGFSADCLETLEEINIRNREFFLDAGGKDFHYIPCLNASSEHIALLKELVLRVC